MDFQKILVYVVAGCLLFVDQVSAYFNQTYGDITFILSSANADNSQSKTSLMNAQDWCQSKGYTLAKISDKEVQSYVQKFITSAFTNVMITDKNVIILNGKLKSDLPGTWIWVNGQQINGVNIQDQPDVSQSYFYGYLKTSDFKLHASTHNNGRAYICEKPGNANNCVGGQSLNGRCYQRKTTLLTWYGAQNDCAEGGGDLASFDTLNDTTFNSTLGSQLLANESSTEYWVGMQRVEWRWEDTGLPIKYTNWEGGSPSNKPTEECLSLRVLQQNSDWLWYGYGCSQTYRFICMATNRTTLVPTIPTSSTATMDASSTNSTSRSVIPTPTSPSFSVQPASNSSALYTNDSRLALGLGIGLGVGAIILAVTIVLAVIFMRRRQKRKSNPTSKRGDTTIPKDLKESDIDAAYAEIVNSGTNKYGASTGNANPGAIYATVQSNGTLLPPVNHAKNDGTQIVYADFDLIQKP